MRANFVEAFEKLCAVLALCDAGDQPVHIVRALHADVGGDDRVLVIAKDRTGRVSSHVFFLAHIQALLAAVEA